MNPVHGAVSRLGSTLECKLYVCDLAGTIGLLLEGDNKCHTVGTRTVVFCLSKDSLQCTFSTI